MWTYHVLLNSREQNDDNEKLYKRSQFQIYK